MEIFPKALRLFVACVLSAGAARELTFRRRHHAGQLTPGEGYSLPYKTSYFVQQVDHFSFVNQDTFKQRYLLADHYWNENGGPIFFYTGNEGNIVWFYNNTGFMEDLAPEFKAMVVFAEHRYYGDSMPYGNLSYKTSEKLQYLTSEQALADFAVLIKHLKATIPGAKKSPVVAFGGSYGGMLAAWLRMKYPSAVDGAIASSAPIWQFKGITPCGDFYKVVTQTFENYSQDCMKNIRASWKTLTDMAAVEEDRDFISKEFKLCKMLNSSDAPKLKSWLAETFVDLAMVDYPYPANFLALLPAWPVSFSFNGRFHQQLTTTAHRILDPSSLEERLQWNTITTGLGGWKFLENKSNLSGRNLIRALAQSIQVYHNTSGEATCFHIAGNDTENLGFSGWSYQACTEMVMPMCTDGVSDMFEPFPWNFTKYSAECYEEYKVQPREDWIETQYWGKNLQSASNIVFSNGLLDPWSSGGVKTNQSESVIAILITKGAHHLDLRSKNPKDPQCVINARTQEKASIREWISGNSKRAVHSSGVRIPIMLYWMYFLIIIFSFLV